MTSIPDPLEYEAQTTVEAYLDEPMGGDELLERVAVLYHREEYFEALELIVSNRKQLLGSSDGADFSEGTPLPSESGTVEIVDPSS